MMQPKTVLKPGFAIMGHFNGADKLHDHYQSIIKPHVGMFLTALWHHMWTPF